MYKNISISNISISNFNRSLVGRVVRINKIQYFFDMTRKNKLPVKINYNLYYKNLINSSYKSSYKSSD